MTIVYVTTGAWGTGSGTPNSAAQVDGNFYDLDQRVVSLNTSLATGKRIDTVTYTDIDMTFHFTDGSSQVILLPIATMQYVGDWANSTPYIRGDLITANNGFYQVLQPHTSPSTGPFDPNAVDGSSRPLYSLWMPIRDVNYDAAIFVPGSIQRSAGELFFVGIANRTMSLASGTANAYAYLDVANNAVGATNIVLSIQKNRTEIGTITFAAGGTVDAGGGQVGVFSIPAQSNFVEGDRYGLKVTQSNNATPSGLSVTLPFIRTDI